MKKMVAATVLLLALVLLCGCIGTAPTNGGDDMNSAADLNKPVDANSDSDTNSSVITNLGQLVKAKIGDTVSVHYVLKSETGEIIQSTIGENPITFQLGTGAVIPGFEQAIIGMKAGETKEVTILPANGYGEIDLSRIVTLDRNKFSDIEPLEIGATITFDNGMKGVLEKFNDNNVTVNFNNPMAGKTLVFDISLVSISK